MQIRQSKPAISQRIVPSLYSITFAMWDVTWTDPEKELVGQHRARKDKDGDSKNKGKSRHSMSTTSSKSSGQAPLSGIRAMAERQSASSKVFTTTRENSATLGNIMPGSSSKNLCRIEMSGGLNAGIVPSTPAALHSATKHGTGDEAVSASSRQHSMASPMSMSLKMSILVIKESSTTCAKSYAMANLLSPTGVYCN